MTVFTPERKVKTYVMKLNAGPSAIFPLLCPIREYEWIEPWSCEMVYSQSGVAENGCVFKTDFPDQGGEETWIVCTYEKDRAISFIRFLHNVKVVRLDIVLEETPDHSTTASWTQVYTGLSETGNQWIRNLLDEQYEQEKTAIEKMLNHYLETGRMLKIKDL